MDDSKRKLQRTEKLAEIRQVFVKAAEAALHEAEARVHHLEESAAANAALIQQVRQENAYANCFSTEAIQNSERYIQKLKLKSEEILQNIEKARRMADIRRGEWREAMRARKIIDNVQERRLHEWQHRMDVEQQKSADEMTIGRYVRNRIAE